MGGLLTLDFPLQEQESGERERLFIKSSSTDEMLRDFRPAKLWSFLLSKLRLWHVQGTAPQGTAEVQGTQVQESHFLFLLSSLVLPIAGVYRKQRSQWVTPDPTHDSLEKIFTQSFKSASSHLKRTWTKERSHHKDTGQHKRDESSSLQELPRLLFHLDETNLTRNCSHWEVTLDHTDNRLTADVLLWQEHLTPSLSRRREQERDAEGLAWGKLRHTCRQRLWVKQGDSPPLPALFSWHQT